MYPHTCIQLTANTVFRDQPLAELLSLWVFIPNLYLAPIERGGKR